MTSFGKALAMLSSPLHSLMPAMDRMQLGFAMRGGGLPQGRGGYVFL
jgi:hypothetical protein